LKARKQVKTPVLGHIAHRGFNGAAPLKARKRAVQVVRRHALAGFNGAAPLKARKRTHQ